MSKATHRYDEAFTIPADATAGDVIELFDVAVRKIAEGNPVADIDWSNLEVRSERNEVYDGSFTNIYQKYEYTHVNLTVRGRK